MISSAAPPAFILLAPFSPARSSNAEGAPDQSNVVATLDENASVDARPMRSSRPGAIGGMRESDPSSTASGYKRSNPMLQDVGRIEILRGSPSMGFGEGSHF